MRTISARDGRARNTGRDGLTDKQAAFVAAFCGGMKPSDAARVAGYPDPAKSGDELMHSPNVCYAIANRLHKVSVTYRQLVERAKNGLSFNLDPKNWEATDERGRRVISPAAVNAAARTVLLAAAGFRDGESPGERAAAADSSEARQAIVDRILAAKEATVQPPPQPGETPLSPPIQGEDVPVDDLPDCGLENLPQSSEPSVN